MNSDPSLTTTQLQPARRWGRKIPEGAVRDPPQEEQRTTDPVTTRASEAQRISCGDIDTALRSLHEA